jgi:hypothetical protein
MKTKVRIIRTNCREIYNQLYLQVLQPKRYGKYLEKAFEITFQTGTDSNDPEDRLKKIWYAYKIEVQTDDPSHLQYALRIAKMIQNKLDYDHKTPQDILNLLNAELYVFYDGDYLPMSLNGSNAYRIYKNDQWYTTYYVKTMEQACKLMEKEFENSMELNKWEARLHKENVQLIADDINL